MDRPRRPRVWSSSITDRERERRRCKTSYGVTSEWVSGAGGASWKEEDEWWNRFLIKAEDVGVKGQPVQWEAGAGLILLHDSLLGCQRSSARKWVPASRVSSQMLESSLKGILSRVCLGRIVGVKWCRRVTGPGDGEGKKGKRGWSHWDMIVFLRLEWQQLEWNSKKWVELKGQFVTESTLKSRLHIYWGSHDTTFTCLKWRLKSN